MNNHITITKQDVRFVMLVNMLLILEQDHVHHVNWENIKAKLVKIRVPIVSLDGTQIRGVIQTVKSVQQDSIRIVFDSQDVRAVQRERIRILLGNHNVWDVTYIRIRIKLVKPHAKIAQVANTVTEMRKLAPAPVQAVVPVSSRLVEPRVKTVLLENMPVALVLPHVLIVPMGITTTVMEIQDVLLDVRLKKVQLPVWAKRVLVIETEALVVVHVEVS